MLEVLTTCITPVGTTTAECETSTLGVTTSDVTENVKSSTDTPVVTSAPTVGVTTGKSETGMLEVLTSAITPSSTDTPVVTSAPTVGVTTGKSETGMLEVRTTCITPVGTTTAECKTSTFGVTTSDVTENVNSSTDTPVVTSAPTVGVTTGRE
ncbi:hypothetical protein CEXT_565941 [Caerostris extrusa]|uniref:Uncharacterized protein n=1 Tax=Caerostris extrusa TaxID=172846 RepID=A0AAV4PCF6_CAEEX|nr:hypothetical protein CEXT_565941 [Caerostris extrusa]